MVQQNFYYADSNGNDFIVIFKHQLIVDLDTPMIKSLCKLKDKLVDGLLLIDNNIKGCDFKMDYYNNDGTWETMCVNGALCAINILDRMKFSFSYNCFQAGDGIHNIKFSNNQIYIKMITPKFKMDDIELHGICGSYIDSGAKHFVLINNILDNDKLYRLAQKIRYDNRFQPDGLNVNFLHIIDSNHINVITYEKGIENIMQSCGSGSVASAFYAAFKQPLSSPLYVLNRGGKFTIEFNKSWDNVWIGGRPFPPKLLDVDL